MVKQLQLSKRLISTNALPTTFKSLIYSTHDSQDCTNVLKLHTYKPSENLSKCIVLRTLAFPINPSDINQLEGVYPSKPKKTMDYSTETPSAIAGNEGVFEVISVPEGVSNLSLGDWVIPLQANFGTWSNYRTCSDDKQLVKVVGTDLPTAATIAVNGCTAYQMVNNYIKWTLGKNEWIIQNAGTSSVSKIVSQIAKSKGIKTLSVIRDRENFDEVANELKTKFGATAVISETQNDDKVFNKEVLPQILGPDGTIKLALNSVGGKSATGIARKLEKDGTMLTFGGMSKMPVNLPTSLFIFKGLKSLGFWVTENSKRDPENKIQTVNAVADMYKRGDLLSVKDEINLIEWDVENDTDEKVMESISNGIKVKGQKNMVVLKW